MSLHEGVNAVDDFRNAIPKSDLRQIFRLYYIDDSTWDMVAMNSELRDQEKNTMCRKDNC